MPNANVQTTREVAARLGIKPGSLSMAVWGRRIPEPAKLGRNYMWTEEDVSRAARAFGVKFVRRADGGPLAGVAAAPAETSQPAVKE